MTRTYRCPTHGRFMAIEYDGDTCPKCLGTGSVPTDTNRQCDGSCEPHVGEVRRVHVVHPNHDWGSFNYCQTAIEEDRSRGMTVTPDQPQAYGMSEVVDAMEKISIAENNWRTATKDKAYQLQADELADLKKIIPFRSTISVAFRENGDYQFRTIEGSAVLGIVANIITREREQAKREALEHLLGYVRTYQQPIEEGQEVDAVRVDHIQDAIAALTPNEPKEAE